VDRTIVRCAVRRIAVTLASLVRAFNHESSVTFYGVDVAASSHALWPFVTWRPACRGRPAGHAPDCVCALLPLVQRVFDIPVCHILKDLIVETVVSRPFASWQDQMLDTTGNLVVATSMPMHVCKAINQSRPKYVSESRSTSAYPR